MVTPAAEADTSFSSKRPELLGNLLFMSQMVLIVGLVYHFQIERPALFVMIGLASIGFVIGIVSGPTYRVRRFVILSLSGILVVLGIRDGAWLIAIGMLLIGVCRLPMAFVYRVVALFVSGALLAFLRVEYTNSPWWSSALWPILGSMFMFRLILYVRATSSKRVDGGAWNTLAYFFMLPNVAFPLFPVVDYQAFQQSQSSKDEHEIYQRGVLWISRGIVHLILYRLIYVNFIVDPTEVVTLGDLVQFMVCTFLLYLRVSGQFHIAVGVLHLFGFSLPETNKLYFLSSGFTDMWRRMNIYWTDFMTKVVFYPTYFKVKRFRQPVATGIATAVVFFVTWLLHSYQWFWLRGGFPLRVQDVLFWGALAVLVIRGVLKEIGANRAHRLNSARGIWKVGIRAAATFFVICFLWSLWSVPSLADWLWMLSGALNVDRKGLLLLSLTLLTVTLLSSWAHGPGKEHRSRLIKISLMPGVRSTISILILIIAALPVVRGLVPPRVAELLKSVQTEKLNPRENVGNSRGYYEQLDAKGVRDEFGEVGTAKVFDKLRNVGNDCATSFHLKRWKMRKDLLQWDLVPSLDLTYPDCWTQRMTFSTNSWGMRDKEYTAVKPPETLRIEVFGASQVMGDGTTDARTFEQIIEDRLNGQGACGANRHFEVMNFGVDGYTIIQQLALLEDRGLKFSPDIIIFTVRGKERLWTPYYISEVARYHTEIPYEQLKILFQKAGLENVARGTVPIPFPSWRRLVKRFGIDPSMPSGELNARAARISDDATNWAWQRFAETSTSHGATPIALALDVVSDDPPEQIPNNAAIQAAGIRTLNLLDVYPEGNRDALRVSSTDVHPNEAGHRVIAEGLYRKLLPIIEAKCQLETTRVR